MKKLIIVWLSLLVATGVSAQRGWYHGGGFYHRGYYAPRVSVGIGIGAYAPFYPYYGYGFSPFYGFGFPYYGYPYYGYGYGYGPGYSRSYRPNKLEVQIREIRQDYAQRIHDARHDKSMKRRDRKKVVHELETARDKAILQAEKDYYNQPPPQQRRHNFNSNNSNSNNN